MKTTIRATKSGFTIVELMIATLVFSTIMLVITFGVINFTSGYYKGVNSSTTQDAARNIMDTITQAIQFSGTKITPTGLPAATMYFCAANQKFVYKPGVLYPDASGAPTPTSPGLYVYPDNGACDPTITVPSPGGKELLGTNMRVAALSVAGSLGQPYTVGIRVAFGDSDLLCSPGLVSTDPNSCKASAPNTSRTSSLPAADIQCRGQIGSQFCAVSGLSSTVVRRIAGS